MPYKDPEKKKARRAKYYAANREAECASAAAWNVAHPARKQATDVRYRHAHIEEIRATDRIYKTILRRRIGMSKQASPRTYSPEGFGTAKLLAKLRGAL